MPRVGHFEFNQVEIFRRISLPEIAHFALLQAYMYVYYFTSLSAHWANIATEGLCPTLNLKDFKGSL